MDQLDPIVTSHNFDKDESYCYLNIFIKSRYGNKHLLIIKFIFIFKL